MSVEPSEKFGNLPTLYFEDLVIGQSASLARRVVGLTVARSGEIEEPLPADSPEGWRADFYESRFHFGQCIAYGAFTSNLVAAVISTRLLGMNGVYLSQTFQYIAPVHAGDNITARVEVVELVYSHKRARLFCECLREGAPVLEGEAWIAVLSRLDSLK